MGKLGLGCMRLPLLDADKADSVDREHACRMVDRFLEEGGTYFDTAYMYHHFQSECIVKEILVDRHPRECYTLADKLPLIYPEKLGDLDALFQEQLEKCGVDYFDYYLLHDVNISHLETAKQYGCFDFLRRLKAEGKARKIGFSFHDSAQLLDQVLAEHPEMDFVQLQINYLDWENEGIQSRLCYETAVRHGKPVVVMEPVKGGTLAQISEEGQQILQALHPDWSPSVWALRFAAGLEQVMVVLSGMSNMEQMEENLRMLKETPPMGPEELQALRRTADLLRGGKEVPCTACRYCVDGCPQQIAIPEYFALYNAEKQAPSSGYSAQKEYYGNLVQSHGKASDCVTCGQCENVCPQHLPIIQKLKDVAALLEH